MLKNLLQSWNISDVYNPSALENQANAEIIATYLQLNFKEKLAILDLACGAVSKSGLNYDPNGDIYLPVVAEILARSGHQVTGIDLRQNDQK